MSHASRATSLFACIALLVMTPGVVPGADLRAHETLLADDGLVISGLELVDAPLAEFRKDLLEQAFQAASLFPLVPHSKNRSKAQEEVILAWVELGQERRAYEALEDVRDWRRGVCLAELALRRAQRGELAGLDLLLTRAEEVAYTAEDAQMQDWRRARILAKVAQTHAWLGRGSELARLDPWVGEGERRELGILEARRMDPEDLERNLARLDALVTEGNFDRLSHALAVCVELFDRFYLDLEARGRIEERLERCGARLPVQMRVEALRKLVESALRHGDREQALDLLARANTLIEGNVWLPEDHVPLVARQAELRHRVGDAERARREVDRALGLFEQGRDRIQSMDRAGALRVVAETYEALGDRRAALRTYELALEEGLVNPNSRPRAFDFVAISCSLARLDVEPGQEFTERLAAVLAKELREPW